MFANKNLNLLKINPLSVLYFNLNNKFNSSISRRHTYLTTVHISDKMNIFG